MLAVKHLAIGSFAAACAATFALAHLDATAQSASPAQKPQSKPKTEAKKAAPAQNEKSQPTAKGDKIMSIDELRACMTMQKANEEEAGALKREQVDFAREQDEVRAAQADVKKVNDELATRAAALRSEQTAMVNRVNELRTVGEAAKTDAEKADYEKERDKLAERNRAHEQAVAGFNAAQQAQVTRIETLNARIGPLNERGKTINDRVEPLQDKVIAWREQCGNRRYREDDETAIKKELAAKK
jgi:hypothetical protein